MEAVDWLPPFVFKDDPLLPDHGKIKKLTIKKGAYVRNENYTH